MRTYRYGREEGIRKALEERPEGATVNELWQFLPGSKRNIRNGIHCLRDKGLVEKVEEGQRPHKWRLIQQPEQDTPQGGSSPPRGVWVTLDGREVPRE